MNKPYCIPYRVFCMISGHPYWCPRTMKLYPCCCLLMLRDYCILIPDIFLTKLKAHWLKENLRRSMFECVIMYDHNFEKKKNLHAPSSRSLFFCSYLGVATDSAGWDSSSTLYRATCTLTLNGWSQGEVCILFLRNLMKSRETLRFGRNKIQVPRDQSLSDLLYSKTKQTQILIDALRVQQTH